MKRNGFAQIPLMIGLLLMAVAIPVATKLVQTNQENRGKATGACPGTETCRYGISDCGANGYYSGTGTCPGGKCCGGPVPTGNDKCTNGPKYCTGGKIYVCKADKSGYTSSNCASGACSSATECKPMPTSTPRPAATSTPRPAATSTPRPAATSTPRPAATSTPRPAATSTPVPGGAACKAQGGYCLSGNSLGTATCAGTVNTSLGCPKSAYMNQPIQGCCLPKAVGPCSSNGCSTKGASATCTYKNSSGIIVTGTHTCNLDMFNNCLTWSECKASIGPTKTPPKPCSSNGCSTLGETGTCSYTLIGVPGVPTGTKVTGTHTCNLDVFSNCLTWSECKANYVTPKPTTAPTAKPPTSAPTAKPPTAKPPTSAPTAKPPTAMPTGTLKCYCMDNCGSYDCNWQTVAGGGYNRYCTSEYCKYEPTPKPPSPTPTTGTLKCYCMDNCGSYDCNWQTVAGGGYNRYCTSEYCKYEPTPKIPTSIPKPPTSTPIPGCISIGTCLPSGKTCCSGYAATVATSVCTTGKKCASPPVQPTSPVATNTPVPPIGCTDNGLCKKSGVPCCSGEVKVVETSVCASGKKCVAAAPSNTPVPGACTQCSGMPNAKGKGNADCTNGTNLVDFSIWRAEFISGLLGSVKKNKWQADFDCNGYVNLNDFSIWRPNFINGLLN